MFDFGWSEIGLIAAVALVLIGPKDLPVAIRAVTDMIKKARRMASEFQTHVDEMVREADLGDVRSTLSDLRNFDIKSAVERHIDPDHSLRDTFASNPLEPTPSVSAAAAASDVAVAELEPVPLAPPEHEIVAEPAADPALAAAPAFVPPAFVPPSAAHDEAAEAPAFIPPQVVLQSRPRA